MNTTPKKYWKPHSNIDNAADLAMLAAWLFIIILGATTVDTDAVPMATQILYQDPAGRIVVTAIRPKAAKAAPDSRPAERIVVTAIRLKAAKAAPDSRPAEDGNAVQLAASSSTGPLNFNQHDLNGDNHAK